MIGAQLVSIELTESEAEAFREFMRVRETLDILTQSGVFMLKNSKAVLNFNGDGVLEAIEFRKSAYKRGKKMIPQVAL